MVACRHLGETIVSNVRVTTTTPSTAPSAVRVCRYDYESVNLAYGTTCILLPLTSNDLEAISVICS